MVNYRGCFPAVPERLLEFAMISVRVERVVVIKNDFVVLLRGPSSPRCLPIHVDPGQAHAIELRLEGLEFPRPLTHDLFKNVLEHLNCQLARVEVCDLREGTFYARIILSRDGIESSVDARPSDAIALALRCSAPIMVAEEVMNEAGVVVQTEKPRKAREDATLEILKKKLQKAIDEERYEDAVGFRDEIAKLTEQKTTN